MMTWCFTFRKWQKRNHKMPRIDSNLSNMIQSIRSGQTELNAETARELISNVTADGRVYESEEIDLLRGLDSMAPSGSVHGRELLKTFVEQGEIRITNAQRREESDYFSPRSTTNPFTRWWNTMGQINPFLKAFQVPPANYAETGRTGSYTTTLADRTEFRAEQALVGERAFHNLVEKYEGAYDVRFGFDLSVTTIPNDDVNNVYLNHVQNQPINENDPLGAVRAYLDANYNLKPE